MMLVSTKRKTISYMHRRSTEKDEFRNMSVKFHISDEHRARMREANGNRCLNPISPESSEYMRRRRLGFYANFDQIDDVSDGSGLLAREKACTVSPSVVALSCKSSSNLPQSSSGIVVEYNKTKTILTSTYILGGHSYAMGLKVEVLLPSGKKIDGEVFRIDEQHNIVLIHGNFESIRATYLSSDLPTLDVDVMCLGRNSTFGLMTSLGKVNIRRDVLESDDLMSSSCIISESGIGGPLVEISTGFVIGINVFMQKKSTLFMPSVILCHSLEQLVHYGEVIRPCVGLKTRSIGEKKMNEVELIYEKFPFTRGIIVNEVRRGSPADEAGICAGDIITLWNNISVSSPVQLADTLLDMGKSHSGVVTLEAAKKRAETIKIQIQRVATGKTELKSITVEDFTPRVINSWPVLPVETFDSEPKLIKL